MIHNFISAKNFTATVKETVWLFKNIWKEGTTTLLHAPRETDKTATALSIAADLASEGRGVLYINAEDRLDGRDIADMDNLYFFTPEYESIDDTTDYADLVFEAIEQAVRTTDIRTFVVDSVSRIAALSFGRNASPAYIMKRLVALQIKCRLSILVVANDTTRSANNALLTLAASEIIMDDKEPQRSSPVEDMSDKSDSSDLSDKTPAPSHKLTRQQRRALQRRIAKQNKRHSRVSDELTASS